MAKKREMEYFEFATAQKSIIASSASVYLNEVSQTLLKKHTGAKCCLQAL
jgi:hypothetical protein